MPQSRYPLRQTKTKAQVIGMMIEGLSDRDIAAALAAKSLTISHQAITAFRKRHAAEIAPVVAEVERQITDAAIASKVQRILDADEDYRRLGQVIEARAADKRYDEPGYSTGVMVHSLKQTGSGQNAVLVDEYKTDTALIAERRALRREVAEELDQLPRGSTNVNIDNRVQVLIRQVDGYDGAIG